MKIPSLTPFQLSSPSIPLRRIGFVLGSLVISQWIFTELVHVPGGGIALLASGVGIWWFLKPVAVGFDAPETVDGWIRRCKDVLDDFETLEDSNDYLKCKKERVEALEAVLERSEPQRIAFVSSNGGMLPNKTKVQSALAGSHPLALSWSSSLSLKDKSWIWPKALYEQDILVYSLPLPLRAADLLWLEKVPEDQPAWVMVDWEDTTNWLDQLNGLKAQLPERWANRILRFNEDNEQLRSVLNPVRQVLEHPSRNIDQTRQRLLSQLHSSWQIELEQLRRNKFRFVQNRTQWVVAGAVFASPVASTDLLAVAVVNGLMIKEMAKLWSCPLRSEVLQVVARQLAGAAVAQGVVEWSGHALLGVAKLHGGSWVAAGTLQALSAAYLTRVVGRSMADWMAINNGVHEPDLEALKREAPLLVAKAAEDERVDWTGFLKQAGAWIDEKTPELRMQTQLIEES